LHAQPLKEEEYVARVNKPATGFTAFFVELVYEQRREVSVQVHY
jgi:hypothetical protein